MSSRAHDIVPVRVSARMRWLLVGMPLVVLIGQIWPVMHNLWMSNITYSHGYLVLLLASWLTVREWHRQPMGEGTPSWTGLVVLAACATGVFLARAADVLIIQQLAIPALIVSSAWSIGGFRLAKRFVVPAGYLYFAIPIWDYLTEPLRALTTEAVGVAARLTTIPVHIVGNSIHVPSGTFEVEGGCSGLHYVIVAAALAGLFAITQYRRLFPRLALITIALLVAVIANWVRVYVIVLVGHATNMQHYLIKVDHYYFGWAVFMVMIVPLFLLSHRLESAIDRISIAMSMHPRTVGSGSSQGLTSADGNPYACPSSAYSALVVPLSAVLLGGVALLDATYERTNAIVPEGAEIRLPDSISEWSLQGDWVESTRPTFVGADSEASGRYVSGDVTVSVQVVGYWWQRQGSELIYYLNRTVPDTDMIVGSSSARLGGREGVPVRRLHIADRDGRQRLVWFSYEVAGIATDRDALAKLYQVFGLLRGRRDARAVVMSVPCVPDCVRAERELERFAMLATPVLMPTFHPSAEYVSEAG